MSRLTVGAVQLAGGEQDGPTPQVVDRMIAGLESCAAAGAQVVAFPELALTRYFPVDPFPGVAAARVQFQDLPDDMTGPLFDRADELDVDMVVPFAEWADGRRYNSAMVWQARHGPVGTYRKVHTPEPVEFEPGRVNAHEKAWFSRGHDFPTFDLRGTRVGVQICFDRHFPETTRSLALNGADLVFLVSNSQSYGAEWRREMWDALCRVRAYENVVFLVAANKTGQEGPMDWHGRSCVVSAGGNILAMAPDSVDDGFVVAHIDLGELPEQRARRRFLAERQPDAYRTRPSSALKAMP